MVETINNIHDTPVKKVSWWMVRVFIIQKHYTNLLRVDVLHESFQRRHEARSQVTVLEEDPLAALHRTLHEGLGSRALKQHGHSP